MLLPLSDQPNPKGVPFATYALILINVAVYVLITLPLSVRPADPQDPLLQEYIKVVSQSLPRGVSVAELVRQVSAYDLFVFAWGYRPADPSVLTLFTAMFLHGGLMHLFGNMLFLWIYGDNVEHRLGPVTFLFWYLATGVAATIFFAVFDRDSLIPMVGASGAISGVLGFYFLWFPHNKVRLWVLFFPFYMNVILAPARWVLGFYLLVDNLLPFFVARGDGGGVAHGAHIGGFVAGLAVAWILNRREVATRPAEYRAAAAPERGSRRPAELIASAIRAGNFEKAAQLYFNIPSERSRRLVSPGDSLALGSWLAQNRHSRAALVVYQRHLRDYPNGPGAAEAHAYAGLVQLHAFGEATAAYQHLVGALDFDPSPETEALVREALAEIAARQKFQVKSRSRRAARQDNRGGNDDE
jgi:membrane associated rhomboid family serine protease